MIVAVALRSPAVNICMYVYTNIYIYISTLIYIYIDVCKYVNN